MAARHRAVICGAVLCVALHTASAGDQATSQSGKSGTPHPSISPQTAALERDFFAAIRGRGRQEILVVCA